MSLSDSDRLYKEISSEWNRLKAIPKKRNKRWRYRRGPTRQQNGLEWIVILVGALAAAIVIRAFLFQAFFIPSSSMESTLLIHDRVLVNKVSYKFHDIHRGDIVVFRKPNTVQGQACYSENDIKDLIKRVIALPGETIESRTESGTTSIYIDDKQLNEPYIKPGSSFGGAVERQVIPAHMVWVMGDNREVSKDSRCAGPIPMNDIVGRAFMVMWPLDSLRFV